MKNLKSLGQFEMQSKKNLFPLQRGAVLDLFWGMHFGSLFFSVYYK